MIADSSQLVWFFYASAFRRALLLKPGISPPRAHTDSKIQSHGRHAADEYERGVALAQAGKDNEAIAAYEKAIQLDPKHFEYYHALDDLLSQRRSGWQKIVTLMSQFIALVPEKGEAYCARGAAYSYLRDFPNTLKDMGTACSLGYQDCCEMLRKYKAFLASKTPVPPPVTAPAAPPRLPQSGPPIVHSARLLGATVVLLIFVVALVIFQGLLNLGKRWKLYGVGLLFLCGLGTLFCVYPHYELVKEGKKVEATVISDLFAYTSYGRHGGGNYYKVTYHFATEGGVTVEGSYTARVANLKPGSTVNIVYLPDHPELNETATTAWGATTVALLLILLLLIGVVYLVIVVLIRWRFESHVLAIGVEAPGTIRSITRPGSKALKMVYTYTFQDSHGIFHSGKCDATAAFITSGLDSGTTGRVKYDPQNPDKNMWIGQSP